MKACLALALAACGAKPMTAAAPPQAPPASIHDQVTIHFHSPSVGARFHDVRQTTFAADRPDGHVEQMTRIDKTTELLSIDHGVVTSARVRYDVDRVISQVKDQSGTKANAIEGHTYVIQSSGAGTAVLGEAGTPVDANQSAQVLHDAHIGALEDPFSSFLDGRTFTIGEAVEVPRQALATLFSGPGLDVTAVHVVFRGMRDGLASFDFALHASSDSDGQLMTIDLSGSVGVDPSIGTAGAMMLTGPVHVSGAATGGTITIENQHSLLP